jgi:alpha-beta hydrolase superfamily lysophospholipase
VSGIATDVLGPPYTVERWALTPDVAGPVPVASLVRWVHPSPRGAMLYLHGYNDYFFHTELAERVWAEGWEVYALDLRRYGRSLQEGELACYIEEIEVYFEELAGALRRMRERDGHQRIWVNAHSTGGLVATRFAQEFPGVIDALVLNAPFFALPPFPLQPLVERAVRLLHGVKPDLPVRQRLFPYYGWSLARSEGPRSPFRGEWSFKQDWKRVIGMHYPPAWLVATRRAQHEVQEAEPIAEPVLVLTSERSFRGLRWSEQHQQADVVLDVDRVVAVAQGLGPRVRVCRLEGALHDVWLSARPVRSLAYGVALPWVAGALVG